MHRSDKGKAILNTVTYDPDYIRITDQRDRWLFICCVKTSELENIIENQCSLLSHRPYRRQY